MNNPVLFVDDEINILNSVRRLLEGYGINVMVADSAKHAMDIMKKNDISVIVSDNLMPDMNGIEFLQKARESFPESVRILMTAHASIQSSIDAINKGEIYKFVLKPWDDDELMGIINDALNRYNLVLSMKMRDEATLRSLAQTIELKDPYTRGHCDRVAEYALMIASELGLSKQQMDHLKYGSWLHDCGKIGVPESVLNHNGPLMPEQMDIIKNHCRWGADVAMLARLPEAVINIILCHHERYDGSGYPAGLKGKEIPIEARIASIADFYDAVTTDRPYRAEIAHDDASGIMLSNSGSMFDPEIVKAFLRVLNKEGGMDRDGK